MNPAAPVTTTFKQAQPPGASEMKLGGKMLVAKSVRDLFLAIGGLLGTR